MAASFVLLDPDSALWAPAHIFDQREARECSLLLVVALSALMPVLLALEAGVMPAVLARDLHLVLSVSPDVLLALQVRTEDKIRVHVDLAGKSQPREALIVLLRQIRLDYGL